LAQPGSGKILVVIRIGIWMQDRICGFFIGQKCLLAGLQKKLQADLAENIREGWTWPNLKVIRFWWCCHLANTMKKALPEVCAF